MALLLTREQVRRVDQLAIEEYHLLGLVLMENAGRNAAAIIRETYGDEESALVFCGTGNNGGDGFVIARHLHNAGWRTRLVIAGDPSRLTPDAKANQRITQAMNLPTAIAPDAETQRGAVSSIGAEDVVIDALLGTGFSGDVRSPLAELIDGINRAAKRGLVAVDVPSGLDCNRGTASNAAIQADLTITFVAAKSGFAVDSALPYVGRVEVADIGTPPELIARILAGQA